MTEYIKRLFPGYKSALLCWRELGLVDRHHTEAEESLALQVQYLTERVTALEGKVNDN